MPGGASSDWDCAAGPTGAAMGGRCCAWACQQGTADRLTRKRKAAARVLIIEKPFGAGCWRLGANNGLMAGDLGRNLTNKFKFHLRHIMAQESQARFWATGAVSPLTW